MGACVEHRPRVLVRLDIDRTSAVIQVRGCLTETRCKGLIALTRRTGDLAEDIAIRVDLSEADHVDSGVLTLLEAFRDEFAGAGPSLGVVAPVTLPQCAHAKGMGRSAEAESPS